LQQGDYNRETVFGDDPAEMAQRWVDDGAQFLHLVDLDAARDGQSANRRAVDAILNQVSIPCELGGGIRDEATIQSWLEAGISRLVVGTKALKEPEWFRRMCAAFPGQLALGIDARDGYVATDGWLETSRVRATELARQFSGLPLASIVYTDIARDGMLAGPNFDAIAEMKDCVESPVIASGGITSADDIRRLVRIGVAGCIVGRSLYDGKITVSEAIAAASSDMAA
jgi:phosphoribosylformimino-5-aminoimidazole carboxamide ribotide isomerase